jgi:hypothetical protein
VATRAGLESRATGLFFPSGLVSGQGLSNTGGTMSKGMAMVVVTMLGVCVAVASATVQWSRFKGTVKSVNGKTSTVTIQNREGDLLTVAITEDVQIFVGKEVKQLREVSIDEKVTLVYSPKAPIPKDPDEPTDGEVYKPAR